PTVRKAGVLHRCRKLRKFFRSRDAFGLDSLIMIVSAIVIIGIMVGITRAFNGELEASYVSLTTTMPRFDPTGAYNATAGPPAVQYTETALLSAYESLRAGTIWALGALLAIAGALFALEQVELVPASTAFSIISKGTIYFVLLFGLPPLWDLYASAVEAGSRQMLGTGPNGTAPLPVVRVFETINGMGISHGQVPKVDNSVLDNLIQLFNGSYMLSNFEDTGKAFILGLIGGLIALGASFLTYMFSAIRQVLTAVLLAGLPVILLLSLVPWFHAITRRLLDTLFGLSIVPIFSSLVMVTGAAYLATISSHPVEEQWFASVAVLVLATFVPTLLVPLLGSLFSSVTSMVTQGIGYGGMMATLAARTGQGMASGAAGAAQAVSQQGLDYGIPYSGLRAAKAGIIGGLKGGMGGGIAGTAGAGSQILRKLGAGELAGEVKNAGIGVGRRFHEAAVQAGYDVIQPQVDWSLTRNSSALLTKLAAEPVPPEKKEASLKVGRNLLALATESRASKNYSGITNHPYFRSVPVSDKETFGRAIASTIEAHGKDPDKLANMAYNLEKMGGLNDENLKEFIRSNSESDNSHSGDKSRAYEHYGR
ncbi:MAG TPA: hypothetical protein VJ792_05155, partial [Candidatus Nitrosotalea sp.]|nr:hypothetical protein [Candidatus Nitrosotalea sp.]